LGDLSGAPKKRQEVNYLTERPGEAVGSFRSPSDLGEGYGFNAVYAGEMAHACGGGGPWTFRYSIRVNEMTYWSENGKNLSWVLDDRVFVTNLGKGRTHFLPELEIF